MPQARGSRPGIDPAGGPRARGRSNLPHETFSARTGQNSMPREEGGNPHEGETRRRSEALEPPRGRPCVAPAATAGRGREQNRSRTAGEILRSARAAPAGERRALISRVQGGEPNSKLRGLARRRADFPRRHFGRPRRERDFGASSNCQLPNTLPAGTVHHSPCMTQVEPRRQTPVLQQERRKEVAEKGGLVVRKSGRVRPPSV